LNLQIFFWIFSFFSSNNDFQSIVAPYSGFGDVAVSG